MSEKRNNQGKSERDDHERCSQDGRPRKKFPEDAVKNIRKGRALVRLLLD
jgi:hypothetical protein